MEIGDRVILAAIDGAESEGATVKDVDGNRLLVRTERGGLEWVDEKLAALDPDATCHTHGCARRTCDADHP
jgi:hypothetical protein